MELPFPKSKIEKSSHIRPYDVRIGVICDEFFYDSVCSAVNVRYIHPTDAFFEKVADIDVLLVVSTWRGLDNEEWRGLVKAESPLRKLVLTLIAECRRHNVKTAFFSKEDPPHFKQFKKFAVACDYVFTTCEEKVEQYKKLCGHDRVWGMPFCVNPAFFNPIVSSGASAARPVVVFAGAWVKKYPQRCEYLRMLFEGVFMAGCDLRIYDRNSCRKGAKWRYPARYGASIRPAVKHKELAASLKRYKWALNANSVTASATMFSVRVYEMIASGIHVVSNYSFGMHRLFPVVSIGYSPRTVADIITRTPKGVLAFQRASGIRDVTTHYSAHSVLGRMFGHMGIPQNGYMPMVAVIADDEEAAKAALSLQTCRSFKVMDRRSAAAVVGHGFDCVMPFSADVDYSPFFIEDAINAFAFPGVDAISAGTDEEWWYRVDTLEHGDNRYLMARCGTALAEALVSGTPLSADAGCFIMPMSAVDGTIYGNCGMAVSNRQKMNVRITVGDDWRGLLLCTMPSLLRCKRFGELGIVLSGVSKRPSLARHFAEGLARDFGNVRIVDDGEAGVECAMEFHAGDEVFASAFDSFVAKMGGAFTASVEGDVLLCGRSIRIVRRGISVKVRDFGIVRRVSGPVACRYGTIDPGGLMIGEEFTPLSRKSVMVRAFRCYRDHGLWKTLRRVVLGKSRKGHGAAAGGGCR